MAQSMPPKDFFVTAVQYTRHTFRDIHPAIDPKNPSNTLAGKIAIITGASRGIGGRGIAPVFALAGVYGLVLVARDESKLARTRTEIQQINPAIDVLTVALDITDAAAVESLFVRIQERYGRHANILVSNAGVSVAGNNGGPVLHDTPVDTWWSNFVSLLHIRHFQPLKATSLISNCRKST
jgi:NAD(P)-dependent dehydrogenase (short-subunit alcohol dehydrogenase family)